MRWATTVVKPWARNTDARFSSGTYSSSAFVLATMARSQ